MHSMFRTSPTNDIAQMNIISAVKNRQATVAVIYHALHGFNFCRLTIAKVALYFGKAENTIRNWINKYEKEGLVGRRKLTPAPSTFTLDERIWIRNYFNSNPTKYLREATQDFKKKFKKYIRFTSGIR